MSLEEEHQALHRRGEMIKFLLLVLALVGTVFVIALLRPLIFERIVPAVLGWDQRTAGPEATLPAAGAPEKPASGEEAPAATDEEDAVPVIMTATPPSDDAGANGDMGAPLPTPRMYEVQAGDSLARIGERFGVPVEALVEVNGIGDPNRIQVGDVLVIPQP